MRLTRWHLAVFPALAALTLSGPAAAQERQVCEIAATLTYASVQMREEGATQKQTARYLAAGIGEAASNATGGRAERQHIANLLGGLATQLLRFAYTIPLDPRLDNPQFAGREIYRMCMSGEL